MNVGRKPFDQALCLLVSTEPTQRRRASRIDHDEPFGIAEQQYAPDAVADARYYRPTALGAEAAVKERWERIRRLIRGTRRGTR